jgi:4-hydroxybenzoate polyprenyltransferase
LKDDVKAGVKSVAMVFGSNPIPVMIVLTLTFLGLTTYSGYQNGQGFWFYVGMAICGLHHAHILQRTDFESPKSCWDGFAGCGWAGLWITAGAFADLVL